MTNSADQLLRDGDIAGARAALVETVRGNPSDVAARMFLFQLLAVVGEWDKAKNQLATLATLSPEAQMLAVAYGQAIDAEKERAEVWAGKRDIALLSPSPWAQQLAEAINHFNAGRTDQGEAAREAAFDAAPDMPGTLDGVTFEYLSDADGRFGPTFEAIVGGRYGLVPFDMLAKVTSAGPQDLRDTVWYPVQLFFKEGQSVAAMLPTRYPGSEASSEVNERLGRATAWHDSPIGQTGSGQHLWSLSTGDDRDLLSVRALTFD